MSPSTIPIARPVEPTLRDVLAELKALRELIGQPPTLTVDQDEAARLTGLSARTLARRADAGEDLGRIRSGSRVLFVRSILERWLEEQTKK